MCAQKLVDVAGNTVAVPVRDRPFNPNRGPRSTNVADLVNDIIRLAENYESHVGVRKRRRRLVDKVTFDAAVAAIIYDLAHFHLTDSAGSIYVTRSNTELGSASRYRAKALNKRFPYVLDLLAKPEMGFLVQRIGVEGYFGNERRSTILPAARLVRKLEEAAVRLDDLVVGHPAEAGDGGDMHDKQRSDLHFCEEQMR